MAKDTPQTGRHIGRRKFLELGLVSAVGLWVLRLARGRASGEEMGPPEPIERPPASAARRTVRLGRTDLEISDISFGSGATAEPDVVRYAYDRGVTYFDTAESYPLGRPGKAEIAIGEALRGKRDRVVIASKTVAKADEDRAVLMARLEKSLKRLQTDFIDVYFNHAVNEPERMTNPEWYEFTELAKKQGKIRYRGMSGHGGRLQESLGVALDQSLVDVILVAYNFGQDPAFYERFTKSFDIVANQAGLPEVLARAHEQGVGVIAMKTLMGARLNDMRSYESDGATFAQAAFRWTLSNPDVDALIVSMKDAAQIDEYLAATPAGPVGAVELDLLRRYVVANSASYCRPACDECERSCPYEVPVSDVLRARMYAADYGEHSIARATYEGLDTDAAACLSCAVESCAGACPSGVSVPTLTRLAAVSLGPRS